MSNKKCHGFYNIQLYASHNQDNHYSEITLLTNVFDKQVKESPCKDEREQKVLSRNGS